MPLRGLAHRQHGRIGTIFVRGPKQLAVDADGVGPLLAYLHNNPVRAGLVPEANRSTWTSHRAYLGLDPVPRWLCVDTGLALAGFADPAAFVAFVRIPPNDPARELLRERRVIEDPEAREAFHRRAAPVVDAAQVVDAAARRLAWR